MRAPVLLGPIVVGLSLAGSAHAAPAGLDLLQPADRTSLRGSPATLAVELAPAPGTTDLRVEIDGDVAMPLDSTTRTAELSLPKGLHHIAVVGRDSQTGEPLRSSVARVAVFPEARAPGPSPRQRHGITAAVAFVLAVGGATALRRRSAP